MIKAMPNTNLSNAVDLRLPELEAEDLARINSVDAKAFITHVLHNPTTLGYPDPTNEFNSLGFVLQPVDATTARVLLVINDERALRSLALYAWFYEAMKYTLHIDENTCVREHVVISTDSKNDSPPTGTASTHGMEVA